MTPLVITSYGRNTLRRLRSELRIIDPSAAPRLAAAWELDPVSPTPTLLDDDLPDLSLADLVAVSALPAAAVLCALHDVAATLEAVHDSGLAHGDLRASTVYVLPDGRAALAQPDAPRVLKRNGRGRARQDDSHAFAVLAAELLTAPPVAAATVLEDALQVDVGRRPVPRALMEALDEIPAEDWPSNNLQRRATERLATQPITQPINRPINRPIAGSPVDLSGATIPRPRVAAAPVIRLGSWPDSMPATFSAPAAPAAAVAAVAAPSPGRFIPDGVEERQRQRPPRRERSVFQRVMEPLVVLLGLATVFTGGAAGASLLFAPTPPSGDPAAEPPHVRRISLSVTPPQALCPYAALHITATIVADGGPGELELRWRLPDGITAQPQSLAFDGGRRVLRTAIDLTLTGREQLLGEVIAVVSPAGARASAPIRYLCRSTVKKDKDRSSAV